MEFRSNALIVGAGPAGSTAARLLSENGIETILLEKDLSFTKPCGGGMPSTAFDELRIPKNAIRKKIDKIRLISPEGNSFEIKLKGGFIAIVKRGEFDSILRDKAENSGARVIEADFRRLEETGRQIKARVSINGEERLITADYLIAADGVNSKVRLALGLRLPSSLYTISGKIKGINADSCEFLFGASHAPMSYSWLFPDAEGISVGTGSHAARTLKDMFKKFCEKRGLDNQCNTSIYRIPLWDGELYNKRNILFAGDAAGHVMPFTYEGIYHAMKAGEFAATAVINGKPSDYKRLWKKRFYSRFLIMKKIGDYFLKDDKSTEKLVALYRKQEIQDITMRLWLKKSLNKGALISFINFFRTALL